MKWNRALVSVALLAACGWLAPTAVFTQGGDGPAQLRAAMHRETVQGDLNGAISEYRRIADGSADRAVRARALLRLGAAYEKSGNGNALAVYERLTREYGDIADAATAARGRLAVLRTGAAAGGGRAQSGPQLSLRRLWSPPGLSGGYDSLSANGRWLTYYSGSNVMLRDMDSGAVRQVTSDGIARQSDSWSDSISPDGAWVAYAHVTHGRRDQADVSELRVTRIDGTERRTLGSWTGNWWVGPGAWSSDQRHLVVPVSEYGGVKQLVLVSLSDGRRSVMIEDRVRGLAPAGFSPDGRHLLVNLQRQFQTRQFDVSVLDLDANLQVRAEHTLLGSDWPESAFGWTPDGKHVIFQSTRNGNPAVWRLPMSGGRASGEPVIVKEIGERARFGALTLDGALVYGTVTSRQNAVTAALDVQGARTSNVRRVTSRFEDITTSIGWSPDGRWLASQRTGQVLTLRDEQAGTERDLALPFSGARSIRWHPDSRSLIVTGISAGRNGIYRVSTTDGVASLLLESPDNPLMPYGFVGKDGSSLYYLPDWQTIAVRRPGASTPTVLIAKPDEQAFLFAVESPDGSTLAAMQPGRLWLVPTGGGAPVERLVVEAGTQLWGVDWMPDGEHLLVATIKPAQGTTMELQLLPTKEGKAVKIGLEKPLGTVFRSTMHLAPSGSRISLTAGDTTFEVWRLENFVPAK